MIVPVRYQVLGPLEARAEEVPASLGGPKQRLVLSVLLIETGRTVSDDRLIDALWPDEAPDGARHAVQTYVSELRRVLDDEIRREGGGYRLIVDRESVDAHRFETLVAAGRERSVDAPAGAASLLREALALWHGEPFGGVAEAPILRAEIHRLTELRLTAVEDRVAADLDAGRHVQVATELEALTREHPFRERLHALHMLALYRSDRQADALHAYHRARRWLAEELGIDPSPELQSLERRILVQDPQLMPLRTQAGSGVVMVAGDAPLPGGLSAVRGFELRETSGGGRFGTTYRAYQASVGREVAVKVLDGEFARQTAFVQSFELRARRLAELDHPHVLPLLDWWREPEAAYVVTPWMRGGNLLRAFRQGPWSLSAALKMVDQVGSALDSAHRRGVVHGDLKAANVLLDADGNARISDFSIVPSLIAEAGRTEEATVRDDIHALGLLAIQALAGAAPDADRTVLVLSQKRADLPADLVAVLAQATSPVAADRHGRVQDFLRDARRAAGTDVVALPTGDDGPDLIRNPYKGLQAFQESDADDFFGRDALVDRLTDALGAHRFVVAGGPSGSGKSSVVRAGLLPAVRSDRVPSGSGWLIASMFPGSYPFEELETAISAVSIAPAGGLRADLVESPQGLHTVLQRVLPANRELLLVIDQFEELWSLTSDPQSRRLFVAALADAVRQERSRLRVLATLRTDFLDRVLEEHSLVDLVRNGLVLVTPPSPDELAQAVSRPARNVGLHFEAGLVDTIVRDVVEQPGALPLMQHALTELVAKRQGRLMSLGQYRVSGAVTGALGRRAQELYLDLGQAGQAVARQIFLRLVAVDEQRQDARRRVRRTELAALGADARLIDTVLQRFGAHRLLSFDRDPVTRGPTVEVAHEALFREWATLRGWIDSRRDDLLVHTRLRVTSGEWSGAGRSSEYLISGGRLEEMERWAARTDMGLTEDERQFLAESRSRAEAVAAARQRRRRGLLLGTSAAAAIAIGLASLAFLQLGRAEAGEREAQARALAAASQDQLDVDPDLALHLALAAVAVATEGDGPPMVEALDALHEANIAHRMTATADVGGFFVAFAGEDRMFSTGPPRLQPTTWDPDTGTVLQLLEPGGAQPIDGAVSSDGRFAAETYIGGQTIVWDLDTGRVSARLGPDDGIALAPAFSPDGAWLAMLMIDGESGDQSVVVFEVESGRRLATFGTGPASDTVFGPGGRWLAVADETSSIVRLHDPLSGAVLATVGDPDLARGVYSIALDASGERLAIFTIGPTRIDVRDVQSGASLQTIALGAEPGEICFAAGGSLLVATAADEFLHVWDVSSGAAVLTLPGSTQVRGLDCIPDGHRVAVSAGGGVARVFDLRAEAASEVASFATDPPVSGHWRTDGSLLATHPDGSLRRYDAINGSVLAEARNLDPGAVFWTALSLDGDLVAAMTMPEAGETQAAISLLDAATLRAVRRMDGVGLPLAFSRDGRLLLAGGQDGAALFDTATGARLLDLRSPEDGGGFEAPAGLFLADGRHVVVKGAARPETWVYELETGRHVATACSADDTIRVALDPAGDRLAIADYPGAIEVWDVDALLAGSSHGYTTCSKDDPAAEDAALIARFSAPGPGGVRFSPDGARLVATSGFEGTLGIWDPGTGQSLFRMEHAGVVSILGFSPDGRHLAIGLDDPDGPLDAIRIYTLDPGELVELAEAKLTRPLTPAECRRYLPSERCPTD
jgi:DNA-binding SARP family transcriptional activator/WD40 repeat protein